MLMLHKYTIQADTGQYTAYNIYFSISLYYIE